MISLQFKSMKSLNLLKMINTCHILVVMLTYFFVEHCFCSKILHGIRQKLILHYSHKQFSFEYIAKKSCLVELDFNSVDNTTHYVRLHAEPYFYILHSIYKPLRVEMAVKVIPFLCLICFRWSYNASWASLLQSRISRL